MEQLLVCPFTLKPLRPFSESELLKFHQKIEAGELFFQKGIPLSFLPEKAYISQNQVYIYLELEGVILLQKQTAVVARNQTENPLKRVSQETVDGFYEELLLNQDGSFQAAPNQESAISEELSDKELVGKLPKSGGTMVTMGTAQVDIIHNLLFCTAFGQHLHLDHKMSRMLGVLGNLKEHSQYILCDQDQLPVEQGSIDSLLSFEFLEGLGKEVQEALFDSLKSAMNAEGVALLVNLEGKTSQLENRFKSVKTKASFTPWKKVKLPQLLFHNIAKTTSSNPKAFSGKRSWGSQLS